MFRHFISQKKAAPTFRARFLQQVVAKIISQLHATSQPRFARYVNMNKEEAKQRVETLSFLNFNHIQILTSDQQHAVATLLAQFLLNPIQIDFEPLIDAIEMLSDKKKGKSFLPFVNDLVAQLDLKAKIDMDWRFLPALANALAQFTNLSSDDEALLKLLKESMSDRIKLLITSDGGIFIPHSFLFLANFMLDRRHGAVYPWYCGYLSLFGEDPISTDRTLTLPGDGANKGYFLKLKPDLAHRNHAYTHTLLMLMFRHVFKDEFKKVNDLKNKQLNSVLLSESGNQVSYFRLLPINVTQEVAKNFGWKKTEKDPYPVLKAAVGLPEASADVTPQSCSINFK